MYFISVMPLVCLFGIANGQKSINTPDVSIGIRSLDAFGFQLLAETSREAGTGRNIVLSSHTIWSMLSSILEGTKGTTEAELRSVLRIPESNDIFKSDYKQIMDSVTGPKDGVTLDFTNAIFSTSQVQMKPTYEHILRNDYKIETRAENFTNSKKALKTIDQYFAVKTKNRVQHFLNEGDVEDGEVLLTSTFFFKGAWSRPFNRSETRIENFYDENNNPLGKVTMMYQAGQFPYLVAPKISSEIIELPFGKDGKMSMVVILPKKGLKLDTMLRELASIDVGSFLELLSSAKVDVPNEDLLVHLPKFNVVSDFTLNTILEKLGVVDMFSHERANLLGIFNHYVCVTRIIQRAEIEVDEGVRVEPAVESSSFQNKIAPTVFKVNRPFAFLLIDKPTKSIIFVGKFSTLKT